MKKKSRNFRNSAMGKTRTRASLRLEKPCSFGSYARADQREDSEVDILVEIEPEISLRFVELSAQIENARVRRSQLRNLCLCHYP
jgi:predicted nucleotidyltransferase